LLAVGRFPDYLEVGSITQLPSECRAEEGIVLWAQLELGWRVDVSYHCDRQLWRYGLAKLGEAAWLPGVDSPLGCGKDLRVVEPGSSSKLGLRAVARDGEAMVYRAMSRIMLRSRLAKGAA